jgi:hypothetical protein
MKRKLILGLVGILAVVGLLAGMALAQDKPAEGRALWESQGITSYRFAVSRNCFCLVRGPVVIEVRDGKMVSIVDVETGKSVVDGFALSEIFAEAATIDLLFERIERAEAEGAALVRVSFDEMYGYPTEIYIDESELMADEEIGYTVSEFEILQ